MATYSAKLVTWDEAVKSDLTYAPELIAWDATTRSKANPDGIYQCAMASRRPSDRGPFQLELALTQIGHGQNTGEDKAPPSLIDWLGGSLILPLGIAGVHDPLSSSRVPTGRRATG